MADTVLAQHIGHASGRLFHLNRNRLQEIEGAFGGPGTMGDFDELADWCELNPTQALDMLAAIRDGLGDAVLFRANANKDE